MKTANFVGSIPPALFLAPNRPFSRNKSTLPSASRPHRSALAQSLPERRKGPGARRGGGEPCQSSPPVLLPRAKPLLAWHWRRRSVASLASHHR
jgi:hypothetical protein